MTKTQLYAGTIERSDAGKGFGFIRAARGDVADGKHVFFHLSALDENMLDPSIGLGVSFDLVKSAKGYRASFVEAA